MWFKVVLKGRCHGSYIMNAEKGREEKTELKRK
jgi:hypothetical protein